jgi:hemoglobin
MAEAEWSEAFQRLGGDEGITNVVDDLYQRILDDPQLAPFFTSVDVDAVRTHQRSLVMAAIGGPAAYSGRDLREAHAGLAITNAHVDLVCDHLTASLDANGAAPTDARHVVELVRRLWNAQAWR